MSYWTTSKTMDTSNPLASVARTNHNMYDRAIPKLYETVTVKEDKENQKQLAYGHSTWFTSRESRIDAFMMTTNLSHWSLHPQGSSYRFHSQVSLGGYSSNRSQTLQRSGRHRIDV
jgi:hypothetical protein